MQIKKKKKKEIGNFHGVGWSGAGGSMWKIRDSCIWIDYFVSSIK